MTWRGLGCFWWTGSVSSALRGTAAPARAGRGRFHKCGHRGMFLGGGVRRTGPALSFLLLVLSSPELSVTAHESVECVHQPHSPAGRRLMVAHLHGLQTATRALLGTTLRFSTPSLARVPVPGRPRCCSLSSASPHAQLISLTMLPSHLPTSRALRRPRRAAAATSTGVVDAAALLEDTQGSTVKPAFFSHFTESRRLSTRHCLMALAALSYPLSGVQGNGDGCG